jgi:carbamoyl-phosphate synthase large subunit
MKNLSTLVTGVGGPAGRAVSHYFQQNGISVICADMATVPEPNFRQLPAASDAAFLPALHHLLDEAEIGLLVPTVTEELLKVSEYRDCIRGKDCSLFVSARESVQIANDKWETVLALSKFGVAVPSSYCGASREELLERVCFPMLSKPRCGRGGRGVSLHPTESDLPTVISADRIYQEFHSGEEYDVNLFAHPGGMTAASVVLKKTALKQGIVGNAVSVRRVDEPEIAALAVNAVSALNMEGPIDIDIRRALDGRPYILEINARVGANVLAAEEILVAMLSSWRDQQ